MAEELLSRIVKGYRADPKGNPETLPKKFDRAAIIDIASGLDTAVKYGMPAWGRDQLLNKILLEGRANAGLNSFNYNNPRAVTLVEKLLEQGLSSKTAEYAGAVLDKTEVAKRLNIPEERAWNGTGISAETGRSGAQHATRAAISKGAQDFPQNAEIKDLITRAAAGNLTPKERILQLDSGDQLLQALLNITAPVTETRGDSSLYYTQAAKDAAGDKLAYARKQATSEERQASKLLFDVDVLRGITDAYRKASGVEPKQYNIGIAPEASDPLMKYLTGEVSKPITTPAPEPSILDKLLSLFK